jgi:hypothetical protein
MQNAEEPSERKANRSIVDDFALRRFRRQETWSGRTLRAHDRDAVEAAEREWWRSTSPSERVTMVDDISADAFSVIGIDAREQRLQRSVTRILRRRS